VSTASTTPTSPSTPTAAATAPHCVILTGIRGCGLISPPTTSASAPSPTLPARPRVFCFNNPSAIHQLRTEYLNRRRNMRSLPRILWKLLQLRKLPCEDHLNPPAGHTRHITFESRNFIRSVRRATLQNFLDLGENLLNFGALALLARKQFFLMVLLEFDKNTIRKMGNRLGDAFAVAPVTRSDPSNFVRRRSRNNRRNRRSDNRRSDWCRRLGNDVEPRNSPIANRRLI